MNKKNIKLSIVLITACIILTRIELELIYQKVIPTSFYIPMALINVFTASLIIAIIIDALKESETYSIC